MVIVIHRKSLVTLFLLLSLNFVYQVSGWSNGGYSNDPLNPDYSTHDWIAEHAMNWLPANERKWIEDNKNYFLYGTEFPDNSAASYSTITGYGDTSKHHNYYTNTGSVTDNSAALRAKAEYDKALIELKAGKYSNAAIYTGSMSHYIDDVAVFGHVMNNESHHSDYENYVQIRTVSYNYGYFESYLVYDGVLSDLSAYDASINLGRNTFNDDGGLHTAIWMDTNYDWSNLDFKKRCGESLNLAVNYLADVLHTLALSGLIEVNFTLTIQPPEGYGTTTPTIGDHSYTIGTNIQVTAYPSNGWQFSHWHKDGADSGTNNLLTINMDKNHSVKAIFTESPIIKYSLSIQAPIGNGTTNPSNGNYTYNLNEITKITASPSTGWKLDYWIIDSNSTSTSNPLSLTMNQNHTLKPYFKQLTYTLSINVIGAGQVVTTPNQTNYHYGDVIQLKAISDGGYLFSSWSGDFTGSSNSTTILMNNNKTVTATFSKIPIIEYSLTIQIPEGLGYTTPAASSYSYNKGAIIQVSAVPVSGYQLDYWLLNGVNVGNINPCTIEMNSSHTLKAFFKQFSYKLTVQTSGSGSTNNTGTNMYSKGSSILISATPSSGWKFDHWELNGDNVGTTNPYKIIINNDIVLKAVFILNTYQEIPSYPIQSVIFGIILITFIIKFLKTNMKNKCLS